MFDKIQSASELEKLITPYLNEEVTIETGIDDDGNPTIKLIDHENESGVELSAEVRSSMHGYSASLKLKEIDAFTVLPLTKKQEELPLERGRIGYHFWNRISGFEGPLKISSRADVRFESTGDSKSYWHADGRFAWAGDTKHKHPRDLVMRIIPPDEKPDEE